MQKKPLFGLSLNELSAITQAEGLPKFAAKQIVRWLYASSITTIDDMSNISLANREKLACNYTFGLQPFTEVVESTDGTRKYLFPTTQGHAVEAVIIPDSNRVTLCLSTQVGCRMGCLFCMTGRQGFRGNLTAGEILNQLRSIPEWEAVTNIVYMGMGEPLDNLENVLQSTQILTSDWGMAMSPRRITVSSIGVIAAMRSFLTESQCHLAISLHTPFDEQRSELMPIQKANPISEIVDELRQHDFSGQRRVSFEYIMFNGINDTQQHVKKIASLLKGLNCRVNLIRYHSLPDSPYKECPQNRMVEFRDALTASGVHTTIRASRGQDIQAACGLLSTERE